MYSTRILGILLLFRISDVLAQSFTAHEGPYKAVISNVTKCAGAPGASLWNITTYTSRGHSLLRGTLRATQALKDIKFRIIMYYLEERKTKVFDMKNQNCHNTIIELIMKTTAVPFNEQNCQIKAGTYRFKDLSVDTIIHSVVQSLWYGTAELRLEIRARNSQSMCVEIYFQIVELK